MSANLVRNPSAEVAVSANDATPGWTTNAGGAWTQVTGGTNDLPAARLGHRYFRSGGGAATGELAQDVDVRAFAAGINAGTLEFEWRAHVRSLAETAPDAGRVVFEYRDESNQNVLGTLDSGVITSIDAWHETADRRTPPEGTGWIRIRLIATRNTGATSDVFFDALSLRAVGNIAAAQLDGGDQR